MTLRFGVLNVGRPSGVRELLTWAQAVEQAGLDSYWVMDHPTIAPDQWVTLTSLAHETERIGIGSLVSCAGYRPPALLARMAADVQQLARGRLTVGIGVGDMPDEFAALDLPYPSLAARRDQQAATAATLRRIWDGQPIPLCISGAGDRALLQVALWGDMSNFGPHTYTGGVPWIAIADRLAALDRACHNVSRDPTSIRRTYIDLPLVLGATQRAVDNKTGGRWPRGGFAGTPDDAVVHYQQIAAAGIDLAVVAIRLEDADTLRLLTDAVLPYFAEEAVYAA